MVELGKSTEVDATEINTTTKSNARLALTSSINDDYACSSFTHDNPYENAPLPNNDHLERQPSKHDPDDDGACKNLDILQTNVSGGKSNRSRAIPGDINEKGNQGGKNNRSNAIPSDISENGNQSGKSNRSRAIPSNISENGNQGGKSNRSNAIPSDISKNGNQGGKNNHSSAISSDISENGDQDGKSDRSSAIPSDIGENGNKVGTDSDTDSSYTTARDSNASSTISSAEASIDEGYGFMLEQSYENIPIMNNDDLGNQTREHNPDDDDIYENSNAMKIVTDVSGGKNNRSSAIPSDISENGNQVCTISDTASAYETARESSASSTESGAEASVTKNTTNAQIQASGRILNIVNANNATFNIAN